MTTFNARTLTDEARLLAAIRYCDVQHVDVMAIQETRDTSADIQHERFGRYTVYREPADPRGHGGVAIILGPRVTATSTPQQLVKHHAMAIKCAAYHAETEPRGTGAARPLEFYVIGLYAPARDTPEQALSVEAVRNFVESNGARLPVFVLADCNGCENDIRHSAAMQHCAAHLGRRWTWQSPNGHTRKQLDFVIVQKRFVSGIRKQTCTQPLPSDHRAITVDYVPRYARTATAERPATDRLDVHQLAYDPIARAAFAQSYPKSDPTSLSELSDKVRTAARVLSKTRRPTNLLPWQTRKRLRLPRFPGTDGDLTRLEAAHADIAASFAKQYSALLGSNPWGAWLHISSIAREEATCGAKVPRKTLHDYFKAAMEIASSNDVRIPRVHFPHRDRVRISSKDFSMDELEAALNTMANHTAAGPDGVPTEAYRVPEVRQDLLRIINGSLDLDALPEDLVAGFLTPIYKKKGDAQDPANHRPIVLLTVALKLVHKMILLRLRKAVDPYLLPCQHAYREGLSTTMSVLPLQELIERAKKSSTPLYAVFCDFTNAFSSVSRPVLFHLLRTYGLPDRLVSFLERTHDQQRLRIRTDGDVHDESIAPNIGVMQGDTLAPYMFLLVMDQILRRIPYDAGAIIDLENANGRAEDAVRLCALAYADDAVLLANSAENAQRLVTAFETAAMEFGLHLNVKPGKTELMVVCHHSVKHTLPTRLDTTKGPVPLTSTYRYLGAWIHAEGIRADAKAPKVGWAADFATRLRSAWYVARKYRRIWTAEIATCLKLKLFHALVIPLLLYNALSYPQADCVQRKLHTETNKLIRYAIRAPLPKSEEERKAEYTHTIALYSHFPPLPIIICRHALVQLGHWTRHAHRAHTKGLLPPPIIPVLSSLDTGHRHRGRNWPPSRIFSALLHHNIDDEVYMTTIKAKAKWREHCRRLILEYSETFTRSVILPNSTPGHATLADWMKAIRTWLEQAL